MTGEGSEYGGKHREIDEDETERVVREIIDEVRKEIEEREASETQEEHGEVKSAEDCVREAIEEIKQEEEERQRALEEWEERQREKEEQLEESHEERAESADKDDFAELEERILENFDDYDIDPEEVKERWRERFEEDVKEQLDGPQEESGKENSENGEQAGDEGRTAEGEVYYTDSSGQVHIEKMESDETAESKAEPSTEVQEQLEESAEIPEPSESQEPETKVQEGEVIPSDEQSSQPQEGTVDHPHVREHEEENEEVEKQSLEIEPKEATPEREKTSEESDNPYPETESSLDVDETVDGQEPHERHEQRDEASDEQVDSFPEIDTEHHPAEEHEHQESEESSEADTRTEESKEEPESREEEIWTSYELDYSSLEDENWKQYLRELFNKISEEEKVAFKEYLREQVETIEDFEELLRKYGLEELLDEEDVMEEVRQFLEFKQVLEANPKRSVEEIAEELGLDVEQALEWSRGESEPKSLKKLLNLEAYYLWDQTLRSYRERDYPTTREDLEHGLAENSELRTSRFLLIEREEALAWIEIMGMRRRGEIKRIIRNGREVYSRKQIMELSEKYGISATEIIEWLRGEKVPSLIEKLGQASQKKSEPKSDKTKQLQKIYQLHSEEHLAERKIASKLGISRNQVRKALRDWEVHERYYGKRQTLSFIASEMNLTIIQLRGIFKQYGWTLQIQTKRPRPSVEEIRRLHLEAGLTFIQIASRTGLQMDEIRDAIGAEKGQTTTEEIYILYFKEGYSFEHICDILGISMKTIRRAFRKNMWKFRTATTTRQLDDKWVHHLYYIEGFSQAEIAVILNVHTDTIQKIFFEQKWIPRGRNDSIEKSDIYFKRRKYQKKRRQKLKDIRVEIFGSKCYACGSEKKRTKSLHLHRKDGIEHSRYLFRSQKQLESLNPDEWVPLCDRCHLAVTLLMNSFGFKWKQIEAVFKEKRMVMDKPKKSLEMPNEDSPVSERYKELVMKFEGQIDDLKRALFGKKCCICGKNDNKESLILHRKDGSVHDPQLTKSKKYLMKLNPDMWVHVCGDCHNIAHWALEKLGINWDRLSRLLKDKK